MDLYRKRGTIYKKLPLQVISDKFRKQEFVLQTLEDTVSGTYTEFVKFQCANDKIKYLEDCEEKDMVIVGFRLTGRKYKKESTGEELYFTNLDVDEIAVINRHNSGPTEIRVGENNDYSEYLPGLDDDEPDLFSSKPDTKEYDDLPF